MLMTTTIGGEVTVMVIMAGDIMAITAKIIIRNLKWTIIIQNLKFTIIPNHKNTIIRNHKRNITHSNPNVNVIRTRARRKAWLEVL